LLIRTLGRLAEEELADQFLQHDGRLRLGDRVARIQRLFFPPDVEADVLLAEQTGRQDRGEGIFRKTIARIDRY